MSLGLRNWLKGRANITKKSATEQIDKLAGAGTAGKLLQRYQAKTIARLKEDNEAETHPRAKVHQRREIAELEGALSEEHSTNVLKGELMRLSPPRHEADEQSDELAQEIDAIAGAAGTAQTFLTSYTDSVIANMPRDNDSEPRPLGKLQLQEKIEKVKASGLTPMQRKNALRFELTRLRSGQAKTSAPPAVTAPPVVPAATSRSLPVNFQFPVAAVLPTPPPILRTPTAPGLREAPVARTAAQHLADGAELEKLVAARSYEKEKARALATITPRQKEKPADPQRTPSSLAPAYAAVFGADKLASVQRSATTSESERDVIRRHFWGYGIKVPGEDFTDLDSRFGAIDESRFRGMARGERNERQQKLNNFLKT